MVTGLTRMGGGGMVTGLTRMGEENGHRVNQDKYTTAPLAIPLYVEYTTAPLAIPLYVEYTGGASDHILHRIRTERKKFPSPGGGVRKS